MHTRVYYDEHIGQFCVTVVYTFESEKSVLLLLPKQFRIAISLLVVRLKARISYSIKKPRTMIFQ